GDGPGGEGGPVGGAAGGAGGGWQGGGRRAAVPRRAAGRAGGGGAPDAGRGGRGAGPGRLPGVDAAARRAGAGRGAGADEESEQMTDERYEQGMAVRRAVLGDAHVDRAEAARSALTSDFQDYITRCAWGEVWTRPGLDRRTRSCITVAMLVALNRGE